MTSVDSTSGGKALAVFCGSRSGANPRYVEAAREVGRTLGTRGHRLVYGGGSAGMMGAVADACLAAGGEVTGVYPKTQFVPEELHKDLTTVVETRDMHERKLEMARLSDAFCVLPGGFGTLDETFEALTWRQIKIHDKPVGLLDVADFWQPMVALIKHLEREGFIDEKTPHPIVSSDAASLLTELLG